MIRIRIKDHDRRPMFSIAVVLSAAALTWFASWLWWSQKQPNSPRRNFEDRMVLYECDGGHRFQAPLAPLNSRECRQNDCNERAWPVWSYQCSRHGAFLLQLRYTSEAHPLKIKAARPLGEAWQAIGEDIGCPKCERALVPDHVLRLPPYESAGAPGLAEPGDVEP